MKRYLMCGLMAALSVPALAQPRNTFGTFEKPFAADSPWNIRPINPVFGTDVLPKPTNFLPTIEAGKFSSKAYLSSSSDQPMTIYPPVGGTLSDGEARVAVPFIVIPRWPTATAPATGTDGHADIFDPIDNKLHSFWKLHFADGKWRAHHYGWSAIDGRGWPDPSHINQGARAVGVAPIAGMMRIHEVNDGDSIYRHALALSLPQQGLSGDPTYVYPATSADVNASTKHTGKIPEGALLMLPQSYTMGITDARVKKVVDTLKTYGARVVDANDNTPFAIYVESGAGFNLFNGNGAQQSAMYDELERIRVALRQVVSAESYVDGNEDPTTAGGPTGTENLLSMRGLWSPYNTTISAVQYNSQTLALEFPSRTTVVEQSNGNGLGIAGGSVARGGVTWSRPVTGATYRISAIGTGNAAFRMTIYVTVKDANGNDVAKEMGNTGYLINGQSRLITWPSGGWVSLMAKNGLNQAGSIRATMIRE